MGTTYQGASTEVLSKPDHDPCSCQVAVFQVPKKVRLLTRKSLQRIAFAGAVCLGLCKLVLFRAPQVYITARCIK